jgi:hypothetical protein
MFFSVKRPEKTVSLLWSANLADDSNVYPVEVFRLGG